MVGTTNFISLVSAVMLLLSLQLLKPSLHQRSPPGLVLLQRHAFYIVDLKIIWKVHSTFQMAEHVREQIRVEFKEDTKVTAPDVSKVRKVCADCTHRNCNRRLVYYSHRSVSYLVE